MKASTSEANPRRRKSNMLSKTSSVVEKPADIDPLPKVEDAFTSITIDDQVLPVIEIRATGDIILDVSFDTTLQCEKSLEGGERAVSRMKEEAQRNNRPPPSVRQLYRVRLDTLKKSSKYFDQLLGSQVFLEGINVKATLAVLAESESDAAHAPAQLLPILKIDEDEEATRTMGREKVFGDLLRILHGGSHATDNKYIGLHYISILITMADRFDCMEPVARYLSGTGPISRIKYPANTSEEIIRKKILIFSSTNMIPRLANATFESCTKDLILQGSKCWSMSDENTTFSSARWWNLPNGLEEELAHRRKQILSCIASLQNHFLNIYMSKNRQCKLGYDSSQACDSFQLGEMIKFLGNKNLISISSFSGIGPDDPEYKWPEAYVGNIGDLVTTLHQVPSYQIDKNHGHCGLRNRIIEPLDYIKQCITHGAGINAARWSKDRHDQSWILQDLNSAATTVKRPFMVGDKEVGEKKRLFEYVNKSELSMGTGVIGTQAAAKEMFISEEWDWTNNKDVVARGLASPFSMRM